MDTFSAKMEWPEEQGFSGQDYADRLERWAQNQTSKIEHAIQEHAPERTGKLKHSIHVRTGFHSAREASWDFVAEPHYTKYVIDGTRPHMIFPHHPPMALHWMDAHGGEVFAAFVHHPGNRPNRFATRAVESISEELTHSFRNEFK